MKKFLTLFFIFLMAGIIACGDSDWQDIVATPTASSVAGEVPSGTVVSLSTATVGAEIWYTTNGSTPTRGGAGSIRYQRPITITAAVTIRAIAFKDGYTNSEMLEAAYTILVVNTVARPTANPAAGAVSSGTTVSLYTTTANAEIWYTTNGSTPTRGGAGSIRYQNPITITVAVTIRAIAFRDGYTNSGMLEAAYTILTVARPTANPVAGGVSSGTTVSLSTTTANAEIWYTTNGSTPTRGGAGSIRYQSPITITEAVTIRAIAFKDGYIDSSILVAAYTILFANTVARLAASPVAGAVSRGTTVSLSTTTANAEIWYTTNGSTPTRGGAGSIRYQNPITINAAVTIRAIAFRDGYNNSEMLVAAYGVTFMSIMEMVWIAPGTFQMDGSDSGGTSRPVTLTGFWMGKYQVTQDQYYAVMGINPSYFHGGAGREPWGTEIQGRRPVEQVSWYGAIAFCNRLSIMEGRTPVYEMQTEANTNVWSTNPDTWGTVPIERNIRWNAVRVVAGSTTGYRLPTEAQWEYACRASTTTAYNTGATITAADAWFHSHALSRTRQVGLLPANAWGLHDMHGNVWEWVWDWFGTYASGAQTNPTGPGSGSFRVLRGGCWNFDAASLRSASRISHSQWSGRYNYGFRVVRP